MSRKYWPTPGRATDLTPTEKRKRGRAQAKARKQRYDEKMYKRGAERLTRMDLYVSEQERRRLREICGANSLRRNELARCLIDAYEKMEAAEAEAKEDTDWVPDKYHPSWRYLTENLSKLLGGDRAVSSTDVALVSEQCRELYDLLCAEATGEGVTRRPLLWL